MSPSRVTLVSLVPASPLTRALVVRSVLAQALEAEVVLLDDLPPLSRLLVLDKLLAVIYFN